MEENVKNGGLGEHVTAFYRLENESDIHILNIALPDAYVEHGNVAILSKEVGIDAETVVEHIEDAYRKIGN